MLIGSILQIHPFDFKPSAPPVGSFLLYVKTSSNTMIFLPLLVSIVDSFIGDIITYPLIIVNYGIATTNG